MALEASIPLLRASLPQDHQPFCAPEVCPFHPLPPQEDVRVGVPQDTGSATPSLPVAVEPANFMEEVARLNNSLLGLFFLVAREMCQCQARGKQERICYTAHQVSG